VNVLFFELAMTAYLVVAVLFMVYLAQRRDSLAQACLIGTGIGFAFHSLALAVRWHEVGGFPVTNPFEAASFFSWTLVLVFLAFDYRYRSHVLGAFIVPMAFLSTLAAAFLREYAKPIDPGLMGPGLATHTSLMLLGAVAFSMSFAVGLMYLIQMRLLKSKRFNTLYYHLPPLDVCDNLIGRGIAVGLPLTTLGILSGAIGNKFTQGRFWEWTPLEVTSLAIWAFYAAMLVGRAWFGVRARKGAYLAILGFAGMVGSFVVLKTLPGGGGHF
jgi:ABC-type transport system involved in cytochrome c biogenesis permease subunit